MIRDRIVYLEERLSYNKGQIEKIQDSCKHHFEDEFPNVNIGEYSERCTICGKTRVV